MHRFPPLRQTLRRTLPSPTGEERCIVRSQKWGKAVWRSGALWLLLLCCLPALAQQRRVQNKPYIDERRWHYGFNVGVHDQWITMQGNGYIDPASGDQWTAKNDQTGWGFSVGVLGELKLHRYLALRFNPTLHFGSKQILFQNQRTGLHESQEMRSTYVGMPIDLKISAPRFNNYRPYFLAGLAPMYDLSTGKHAMLRAKPLNLFLELGAGCDIYLPFFKFIPELKFCLGLGNILDKKRKDLTDPSQTIYTQSMDKATAGMVVVSFYIE